MSTMYTLLETCPELRWVRYMDSWKRITMEEVIKFWKFLRENNLDLDCGEEEWKQVKCQDF